MQYKSMDNIQQWVFTKRRELLSQKIECQERFKRLLKKANVLYIRESPRFKMNTGEFCFMDFYIPYYKLDIELDGKQHRDIEHFKRDVEKSEFLWNDEHIATVRISNEKVRELQRLDIQAIWECVDREKRNVIERELLQRREGWLNFYKYNEFDVNTPIWLYSKENFQFLQYNNVIEAQRACLLSDDKKFYDILEGETKYNFIAAFCEDELNEMLEDLKK